MFRARESYFAKKCFKLGEILVPEENGLNTIELAIFSLGSTKRSALPGTQRKRGPAEFLHIFQEAKKKIPPSEPPFLLPWALRETHFPTLAQSCLQKILYLRCR